MLQLATHGQRVFVKNVLSDIQFMNKPLGDVLVTFRLHISSRVRCNSSYGFESLLPYFGMTYTASSKCSIIFIAAPNFERARRMAQLPR